MIAGDIDIRDIFSSLSELEDRLVAENKTWPDGGWEGAFVKEHELIVEDVDKVVLVPGELEEKGKVAFGWRLPFKYRENMQRIEDLKEGLALQN